MRKVVAFALSPHEEPHYLYDCGGRLLGAGFAQAPMSGYTPSSGQPWYDTSHIPSARARVNYDLDGGGRVLNLYYHWDTASGANYSVNNITGFQYAYDPLSTFKTSSTFLNPNGNAFTADHQETYGYSGNFDYLTSASYNDGLANASPSWSYDASGNRASDSTNPGTWTYDNLNRMTASPMGSYGNDILGNRQTGPGSSITWDALNRMTSYTANGGTTNYTYRAGGLRVFKTLGQTSSSFAYDGQMGFEDVDATGGTPTVTDYGLGARGIDRIQKGSAVVYPILDGHGSMVADLSASSGSWSTHDQRLFDAWGQIRSGAQTGDPKGRYCASLGHKQDDESGLTYMRARYYEPLTGRFVSEDPGCCGPNWFSYCRSNPVNRVDRTGKDDVSECLNLAGNILVMVGIWFLDGFNLNLDFAIDFITDKVTGFLSKYHNLDKYWAKIIDMAVSFAWMAKTWEEQETFAGLARAYEGWIGYETILVGQMLLTDGEFLSPGSGDEWWGYDSGNFEKSEH